MKRHGNLWGQVVAWENLLLAARKSQRGKRKREIVQRFHFHEESHLLRLQHELIDGSYRPGAFHTHWIDRPKARLISAAPYRTWSSHRLLPKQNVRQFRRRLSWMKKAYSEGWICSQEIWPRLASWLGHARNVNSHRLIEKLSQDWIFVRCPA